MDLSSLPLINPSAAVKVTADSSWRGHVLYLMNVTLQRKGEKEKNEPESLVSAKFSERLN